MLLNTDSCMFVLLVAAAFKINIPRTPEISKYSSCISVNAMLFIQCHFSCPALYLFFRLIYVLLLQPQGLMHLVSFPWLNAGAFACHPSAFPPLVSCISSQRNGLELKQLLTCVLGSRSIHRVFFFMGLVANSFNLGCFAF